MFICTSILELSHAEPFFESIILFKDVLQESEKGKSKKREDLGLEKKHSDDTTNYLMVWLRARNFDA